IDDPDVRDRACIYWKLLLTAILGIVLAYVRDRACIHAFKF
ncbi:hypothetical protein Tco_0604974, partial [Tanacetum coccineum]